MTLSQIVKKPKLIYKNRSNVTQFLIYSFQLLNETPKNGLRFEIARLFTALLQFKSVQRYPSVIFGTNTGNASEEILDFIHYSPRKLTSIAVTA